MILHEEKSASSPAINHHDSKQNSPIIPQRTRPSRPIEPHLDVDITLVHFEQVLQNRIALARIQPDNPHRHRAVHEEALPARYRVDADKRVASLDILGPGVRVVAVEVGVRGAVDSVAAVDDLAESWGEFLVGGVARGPEGVAADGGDRVVVQVCYAGWLALVGSGIDVSLVLGLEYVLITTLTDQYATPEYRWVCGNWPHSRTSQDPAR